MKTTKTKPRPQLPCYGCGKITAPLDLCEDCSLDYLTHRVEQARLDLTKGMLSSKRWNCSVDIARLRGYLSEAEKDLARAKGRLEGRLEEAKK